MGINSRLNHWRKYEEKEVFESCKAIFGKSSEHNTLILYGRLIGLLLLVWLFASGVTLVAIFLVGNEYSSFLLDISGSFVAPIYFYIVIVLISTMLILWVFKYFFPLNDKIWIRSWIKSLGNFVGIGTSVGFIAGVVASIVMFLSPKEVMIEFDIVILVTVFSLAGTFGAFLLSLLWSSAKICTSFVSAPLGFIVYMFALFLIKRTLDFFAKEDFLKLMFRSSQNYFQNKISNRVFETYDKIYGISGQDKKYMHDLANSEIRGMYNTILKDFNFDILSWSIFALLLLFILCCVVIYDYPNWRNLCKIFDVELYKRARLSINESRIFLRRERDFLNSNEVESLKALMKDVKYKTEHSVFHTRRAVDTLVLEKRTLEKSVFYRRKSVNSHEIDGKHPA